jgi:5-methyltetrahydrofolate--homocysteine methyltransferase
MTKKGISAGNGLLPQLAEAIVRGNSKKVETLTRAMLETGVDVFSIMNHGLIPGILSASQNFKTYVFAIPELLMACRAVKFGLNLIRPLIRDNISSPQGRILIGSVKNDIHDIGKNILTMILEGHAFQMIDLGVDVSPEKFLRAAEKYQPQITAMSALLTVTMPWMKTTIQLLRAEGFATMKVLVGGAPVTQVFANRIGADGYCQDAADAPAIVHKLLGT